MEIGCTEIIGSTLGLRPDAKAPGCDDILLPGSGISVIQKRSQAPPPPTGQGWRKGASIRERTESLIGDYILNQKKATKKVIINNQLPK
jgi:hypothetical protein